MVQHRDLSWTRVKMTVRKSHGHPVLILGAGRGGSALLEMFLEDDLVNIIAIVDSNPEAPGIRLARSHGIPTFSDAAEALEACKSYPDCIVYNLTHDDTIADLTSKVLGNKKVTTCSEAKLFWQMITSLKRIKGELEKSQGELQAIIAHVMDGIISISASGEIQGFNPAAERIFEYSRIDVLNKHINMLIPETIISEHSTSDQSIQAGEEPTVAESRQEVLAFRRSGKLFPLELSLSEMNMDGKRRFIGIVRDITERKQIEQRISHLAHHDYLTDLPNRILFLDRLNQAILRAKRGRHRVAILFLDLDGFKQVNDTLGHDAGDTVLLEVAKRLVKLVRASDTVARIGGDEFTFVLNNVEQNENAAYLSKKIITALSEPFHVEGRQCQIGASIGISIFPDNAVSPESLLIQADEAMYLAKQQGKNQYKFY